MDMVTGIFFNSSLRLCDLLSNDIDLTDLVRNLGVTPSKS